MKYLVLLCDGMADYKIPQLGNRTIIEYANIPNMDYLAKNGSCGKIHTVPEGMYPGSDICNLSIFGYDPRKYYTGRSPLEAASKGIDLDDNDMAFRCNIVTYSENYSKMKDFSGEHVSQKTADNIIKRLNSEFKSEGFEFYSGVGYRNLMIVRDCDYNITSTPPHDIMGKNIDEYLPVGKGADKLVAVMKRANEIIAEMESENANGIWLWGEGRKPNMDPFQKLYGVGGSVVAAVDLIKGIGKYAGLDVIDVPGATGFIDTNFEGKAEYAVKSLENKDYVFVHVEAPDEAGHMGSIEEKIKAAENIDSIMLPIIMDGLANFDNFRILLTPDHPTPISLKTHVADPVPAIIYGSNVKKDKNVSYSEFITPSFDIVDGYKIADYFINKPII